ncbi:MAG: peroxiredoxin family protein [Planctomycetota bacterium]|jgi:hypothetical protein
MMKKYEDSPVAVIGIASPASRGSATKIKARYKVEFPNACDLGGATFALWGVHPVSSFGFVVNEQGKIAYGYDLGFTFSGSKKAVFAEEATRYLRGAKDPFGITDVPATCKPVYKYLKYGQFGQARALAKRLLRSKDSQVKDFAEKVIAAADKTEQEKIDLMKQLAEEGRAGELQVEMEAFAIAFPTSRQKSKLRSCLSKAKSTADGRKEYLAASNFKKALMILKGHKKKAAQFCDAIAMQLGSTYHGKLAGKLSDGIKKATAKRTK